MRYLQYLLATCLLGIAVHAKADWSDSDINDILDKVRATYNVVNGNVKEAAHDLVEQMQDRPATLTETVHELLTWFQHRRTPYLDFVNGGATRCAQGSPCARFRAELKSFALDIADLKDRFPSIAQHGLGDPALFANATDILPPFVLFGVHEILRHIPAWQDLPADLADLYDEIGDPEAFSVDLEPGQQTFAASATSATAVSLDRATTPADIFCSKGKEPLVDQVRLNRLKALLVRWKNRFDSISEYPPDQAFLTLVGEGAGAVKVPAGPFMTTVSNAIDSIVNLVDTYRANLEACKKIEADVAGCAPLVEYRTSAGSRKAYWVVHGIVNRKSSSDAGLDTSTADTWLDKSRIAYGNSNWKKAYSHICAAYAAL